MKQSKLIELVESVETFTDAWNTANTIYESKSHDFEFIRKSNGWTCRVMKITKKVDGKEVIYTKKFVFEEEAESIPVVFKKAALRYLS